MSVDSPEFHQPLADVCHRLGKEVAGVFSAETVERYIGDSLERWREARITT